jgi:hypothetical protein
MPAPSPSRKSAATTIKEKLLRPALTSHFECTFTPPRSVIDWIRNNREFNYDDINNRELITLSCSEASLPGSSLATNELVDDHHGVAERHAYRRQYDDRADFTFYVDAPRNEGDKGYKVLWFFEQWIGYIAAEEYAEGLDDANYFYRFRLPETYRNDIYITKFERDYDLSLSDYARKGFSNESSREYLEYKFLEAYPISINSMPVSYDNSQLLKCTVSFTYTRYIPRRKRVSITTRDFDSLRVQPSASPVLENQVGTPVPLEYRPILPGFGLGGIITDNVT